MDDRRLERLVKVELEVQELTRRFDRVAPMLQRMQDESSGRGAVRGFVMGLVPWLALAVAVLAYLTPG